jgi:poly-gamma-glutamate synthesis protein (capsule biosynthesis protein)
MVRTVRHRAAVAGLVGMLALLVIPGDEHPSEGDRHTSASPSFPTVDGDERAGAAAPAPTMPPPRSFTLAATGDVLLHSTLWDQAQDDAAAAGGQRLDFRPLLAGVKPLVSGADLAICHLETPIAPAGGPFAGYPAFSVPPEIAPALADTGFDACSTASNHAYDGGAAGVDRTLDALDAAGIRHAGSARNPAEAATTTVVTVAGADVALLSYTYGFNGIAAPDGQAWRSNPIDEARILADAARARAGGAEVVVVALHWGDEYRSEPNTLQRALGPGLVRSPDVDLVLGHHAHVVQPVEPVDGEWVVYGMGNLVAHHGTRVPANEEGLLVRFTFTEGAAGWRVTQAEYAALLVAKRGPPIRVVDVGATLAGGGADPDQRARLQQAWDRTTAVVGSLGGPAHGLRPVPP